MAYSKSEEEEVITSVLPIDLSECMELKETPASKSPDIDAGWAKVIVGASLFAAAISSGVYFTFSMYFPLLLNEFGESRSVTAWVGSLNNGVYMLAGPIATLFIERIGCRLTIMLGGTIATLGLALSSLAPNLTMLFFTYGVITAFGLCLNYTSWIVAISDSFQEKHALAFSLSQSGNGLGIFLFGPFFSFMIDVFGWRGAFLITGGCTFHLACLGALVFPPRPPPGQKRISPESVPLRIKKEYKEKQPRRRNEQNLSADTLGSAVKITSNARNSGKRFDYCAWMLHLSSLFWLLATSIPYILLADYTRSLDLEKYYIIMLSTMGGGDFLGRLLIVPLVTFWKLDVTKIYGITQIMCAMSILSFTVVIDGIQMIIQGFLFSMSFSLQCVLLALVPRSLFGSENLNRIFGITMFFGGTGILVGPPIAGQLVDMTEDRSYWLAFVFSALIQLLAAAATFGCLLCAKRRS